MRSFTSNSPAVIKHSSVNRVQEVFLRVVDLPNAQRARYLDQVSPKDSTVRKEVESLLRHHHANSVFASPPASANERPSASLVSKILPATRYLIPKKHKTTLWLACFLTGMLFTSIFLIQRTKDEIRKSRKEELLTLLKHKRQAMDIWIIEEAQKVKQLAGIPELQPIIRELVKMGKEGEEGIHKLKETPLRKQLYQLLNQNSDQSDHSYFVVNSREGVILSLPFDPPSWIGVRYGEWIWRRIKEIEATGFVFTYPSTINKYIFEKRIVDQYANTEYGEVGFTVPFLDEEDQIIAQLTMGYYKDHLFDTILLNPDHSWGTDIYAFNEFGYFLNNTDNLDKLKQMGLFGLDTLITPIWNHQVRDPGEDLLSGSLIIDDFASKPYTKLVCKALAVKEKPVSKDKFGLMVKPYRNYCGREVIGAWTWYDEHHFGIAAEMETAKAYAAFRWLDALQVLIILLLIIVLFAFRYTYLIKLLFKKPNRIGAYSIREKVGDGGMGIVYRAEHELLKRPTAIKLIKRDKENAQTLARFEREVQCISQLGHPNTVQVYDFGKTAEGSFYYAMELIEGLTLAEVMDLHGPQAPERVVHILKQICNSLQEAHQKGLVHRDIKPQNIMLCKQGMEYDYIKVLDFGLVKEFQSDLDLELTGPLQITGTPGYMAPERITSPRSAGPAVDIFSIGAVAYYLLSGHPAYYFYSELGGLIQVSKQNLIPLQQMLGARVPKELSQLVMDCLAFDPAQRPASIEQVQAALQAIPLPAWQQGDARAWWQTYQ